MSALAYISSLFCFLLIDACPSLNGVARPSIILFINSISTVCFNSSRPSIMGGLLGEHVGLSQVACFPTTSIPGHSYMQGGPTHLFQLTTSPQQYNPPLHHLIDQIVVVSRRLSPWL
ncbi:hypothetical protein B0H67DRAFT_236688 [Lasiosphaeris hirsuta]|uniref:Secreted protein n=1 Tax=Lasiosphaeris hirsuta TaxID=260670 RepID=A0AA40AG58_9PEZI|nr:hypothetical protein B0H67DRAFT_236688 [Lasiosphaeris hirsuta]